VHKADLLLVGGTSLSVYPAAGLVAEFTGKHLVLMNREETAFDSRASAVLRGSIGTTLRALTDG
jgi:NAD-dependent deacetylase